MPVKCCRCNKYIVKQKKIFEGNEFKEIFCRTCKIMDYECRLSRLEFIINTMKKNRDEIHKPYASV